MKLSGAQYKALVATLLDAFPTEIALAELVRYRLDLDLDAEFSGGSLRERVFRLVEWAIARGRLPELLNGARDENPGNQDLRTIVTELTSAAVAATVPGDDRARVLDALRAAEHRGELGSLLVAAFAIPTGRPPAAVRSAAEPGLLMRAAIPLATRAVSELEVASGTLDRNVEATERPPGAEARERVMRLAAEYDRTRERLNASPMRTSILEGIASQLRAQAQTTLTMVAELEESESAGLRLALVMALQDRPDPARAVWLSRAVVGERPFVGYHAALALRGLARSVSADGVPALREVLTRTIAEAGELPPDAERQNLLRRALEIVEGREVRGQM